MHAQSRLWLASPAASRGASEPTLERLAARPLRLVAHAPGAEHTDLATRLAERVAAPARVSADLERSDAAALDCLGRLAVENAGAEFVVFADAGLLGLAAALALGLLADDPGLALRPGALGAFNWPAGSVPEGQPELIGFDLDWLPPVLLGQARSRFPGGPGVAGTSR